MANIESDFCLKNNLYQECLSTNPATWTFFFWTFYLKKDKG